MRHRDDVLVGSFMAEILVLPHHTPTIGGHETVSLAPDDSLDCDRDAIRVYGTKDPIELVGYLQHSHLCVLRDLLNCGFIWIEGYVPEIAPAELRGVNVSCRINVYSNENDFKEVKSAIADAGIRLFSPPVDPNQQDVGSSSTANSSVDENQKGVDTSTAKSSVDENHKVEDWSTAKSSVDEKQKGVDSSTAQSSVDEKQKGVERSTAKKGKVLGPDSGIFHNKKVIDVWNYIQKNNLQRKKKYVICDVNLKKVFNGQPRVEITGIESLINFFVYNHKLVDAES